MKTCKVFEGSIFIVHNQFSSSGVKSHRYLMIGSNANECDASLYQAFAITSMNDKNITMEVPIILSNGYVSYIVPYNMHSLHYKDIDYRRYDGVVVDTEYIKRDEFIQMLKDIYLDSIGMGTKSHDEVVKQYKEYCENFKKHHPDAKEWRNREVTSTPYRNNDNQCQSYRNGSAIINDRRRPRCNNRNNQYRYGESHLSHSPRFCDDEQYQYHRNFKDNR